MDSPYTDVVPCLMQYIRGHTILFSLAAHNSCLFVASILIPSSVRNTHVSAMWPSQKLPARYSARCLSLGFANGLCHPCLPSVFVIGICQCCLPQVLPIGACHQFATGACHRSCALVLVIGGCHRCNGAGRRSCTKQSVEWAVYLITLKYQLRTG